MTQFIALAARYGMSTQESFFNVDARRHLAPSLMDDVPSDEIRCVCPGGGSAALPCLREYTQVGNYLCDACREHCWGDRAGERVRLVDAYGPTYTHVEPIQGPPPPVPTVPMQWAPNPKRRRVHLYAKTPGQPTAICKQSQAEDWDTVTRMAGTHNELPECQNCARLSAREAQ